MNQLLLRDLTELPNGKVKKTDLLDLLAPHVRMLDIEALVPLRPCESDLVVPSTVSLAPMDSPLRRLTDEFLAAQSERLIQAIPNPYRDPFRYLQREYGIDIPVGLEDLAIFMVLAFQADPIAFGTAVVDLYPVNQTTSWTKPTAATLRFARILLIGGGGAGGGGARGGQSGNQSAGGGGGQGGSGISRMVNLATLSTGNVVVGATAAGGAAQATANTNGNNGTTGNNTTFAGLTANGGGAGSGGTQGGGAQTGPGGSGGTGDINGTAGGQGKSGSNAGGDAVDGTVGPAGSGGGGGAGATANTDQADGGLGGRGWFGVGKHGTSTSGFGGIAPGGAGSPGTPNRGEGGCGGGGEQRCHHQRRRGRRGQRHEWRKLWRGRGWRWRSGKLSYFRKRRRGWQRWCRLCTGDNVLERKENQMAWEETEKRQALTEGLAIVRKLADALEALDKTSRGEMGDLQAVLVCKGVVTATTAWYAKIPADVVD